MSLDFLHPIEPPDRREWYQCTFCKIDLRSHNHRIDCTLTPVDRAQEVERVRFIINQIHTNKGLRICNGRESDE